MSHNLSTLVIHHKPIRELVLKVKSDEDFVLLGLKSNISEEDFNKIIDESNVKLTSN